MKKGGSIQTLERVNEIKIRKLLGAVGEGFERLEASGVVHRAGYFYVVFDNLSQVARIRDDLQTGDDCLLGREDGKQGYEGITYSEQERAFYTVIEMKEWENAGYYAWVHAYDDRFSFLGEARLDFRFPHHKKGKDDKGFEGLAYLYRHGCSYLLALCEGNKCLGGKKGEKPGGGRIQVFRKDQDNWVFSREIRLPKTVRFTDYSGLDIRHGKVAVVSQKDSRLWISTLDEEHWRLDEGEIYRFPRNKKGKKKYCNVEGVSWISDTQIVVVSDSKKKRQPGRCKGKGQSIHIFEIPEEMG